MKIICNTNISFLLKKIINYIRGRQAPAANLALVKPRINKFCSEEPNADFTLTEKPRLSNAYYTVFGHPKFTITVKFEVVLT